MGFRDNWRFTYTVDNIKQAAIEKEAWHLNRHAFWKEKNDEVMTKIKSEGLEISKSVAQSYSNSGRNAQVMVRTDLQVDLNECQSKITEHLNKYKDYQAWVFVLDSQPPQNLLELSKDDYLYFYGK